MKKVLLLLLFIPCLLSAQELPKYIKNPTGKKQKKCKKFRELSRKLPIELRYSVGLTGREVYFYFPSEEVFRKIFNNKYDGIAIDIISRDQYSCTDGNQFTDSWAYRGKLLEPRLKKDLRGRMFVDNNEGVIVNVGTVPEHFDELNVEANMLLLQKKYRCEYKGFRNAPFNQWQLLEMGLYRDSLATPTLEEMRLAKTMTFEVPFEKSRHHYAPEEIKPLYDSLQLSDFYIRAINIEAYSSVEGTFELNQQLHNDRATSIVTGLQEYQQPEIPFEIQAMENWEEFYTDIEGTRYRSLANYTNGQIKKALDSLASRDDMEAILAPHRKAIITLTLEKKLSREDPNALVEMFGQSIRSKKIEDALYVQHYVFDQIKDNRLPADFLGKLKIPKLAAFNPLLTNEIIFSYENSIGSIEEHILAFEELLKLLPKNPEIQYNLAALKLTAANKQTFTGMRKEIWNLIRAAERKMDKSLVQRLKINYFILNTEFLSGLRAYRQKNRSLRQVYATYRKIELSDKERLYLSRFLAQYSQFRWAEAILAKRAFEEDADPALVEYYFRLTIVDKRKISRSNYQQLIKNSISKHQEMFCKLFLPMPQGGLTFQLLDNPELSKLYCDVCEQ